MRLSVIVPAFFAATLFLFSAADAHAERVTSTVSKVGCHADSDGCFAHLTVPIGPSACRKVQVRWHGDGVNGKNVLSTFLAAQLSGKKVTVYVSDDPTQCWGSQGPRVVYVYMN